MSKNAIIAILLLVVLVLVVGFLMRGPSQPVGSGSAIAPAPSAQRPAVTNPSPPATAPSDYGGRRTTMRDDDASAAASAPVRISPESEHEVQVFADRHSIPPERAIEIIRDANGDRAAADDAAKNLTARI